jgi:hypothetical protein
MVSEQTGRSRMPGWNVSNIRSAWTTVLVRLLARVIGVGIESADVLVEEVAKQRGEIPRADSATN